MPGLIQHLPSTSSPLGRLDPRWKLAALLVLGSSFVALHSATTAALALAGSSLLAVLGRLPWRWALARLGLVLLLLAPFLLLLPWVHRDVTVCWEWGPLRLSAAGLGVAGQLAAKTLALTLLVLTVLATAPLPTTLQAAQALRLPSVLVQLALLTYRYIFVLAGELSRLRLALRVRGYRQRPSLHGYRTVGHVAGTLLVRGYEQAERVEHALRCRGFDGTFRALHEFRTRPADVGALLLIVAFAAVLLAWDYLQ